MKIEKIPFHNATPTRNNMREKENACMRIRRKKKDRYRHELTKKESTQTHPV